jgi:hypothetical protein
MWRYCVGGKPVAGPVVLLFRDDGRRTDVVEVARMTVHNWANEYLDGGPDDGGRHRVTVKACQDESSGRSVTRLVPSTLLAALWLQFWRAFTDDRLKQKPCKECGRFFEVSGDAGGRTARAVFCSDSCRVTAFRRRKDRAIELKEKGKSVEEIARVTETDKGRVRKWLKTRKG